MLSRRPEQSILKRNARLKAGRAFPLSGQFRSPG